MAKVATQGPISSSALHFSGGPSKVSTAIKRKTPSKLRGEQLKRANVVSEFPTNEINFKSRDPVWLSIVGALKSCSAPFDSAAKTIPPISRRDSLASSSVTGVGVVRACKTSEKMGENKFLSVKEVSSGGENLSGRETVDLDNALKGFIHVAPLPFGLPSDTIEKIGDIAPGNFSLEFQMHEQKSPLDFTLKTTMRVVSSSVKWFHRLVSCGAYGDLPQLRLVSFGNSQIPGYGGQRDNPVALLSWVYPQSSLPPSVISALTSSAGGGVQMDFFRNRQSAWEGALRNLYYMLRKRICHIFHACTSQFVVMFLGDGTNESKTECHAYVSQSTKRAFEQITTEDLVELSEMEKSNLGQIRRQATMSDVDYSSQSLLAFNGNENVHGLYDFFLNYRFLLTSLSGVDVPVLYSPVPFQNAFLSSPEVECKEVKTVDNISFSVNECNMEDKPNKGSSAGFYNSIELKASHLPPWDISNVFEAMCSEGMDFEASFVTESTSTGLNVVLDLFCPKLNAQAPSAAEVQGTSNSFIANTAVSLFMCSTYLKGSKYANGSYSASFSPV